MTFKEQAIADLPTFLSVDEFADTLDIDGVSMAGVLMADEVMGPPGDDGVSQLEQTLHVRASDFEEAPVVRQRLTINERPADVLGVDVQQGLLVIRLRWWDS